MVTASEQEAWDAFRLFEIKDRSFFDYWAHRESEELKLFWVRNSNGYPRPFLVESAQLALYVALRNGDLKEVRNGHATLVEETYLGKNPAFASAIQKAIRAGKPGAVRCSKDGSIRVGQTDFAPLHLV